MARTIMTVQITRIDSAATQSSRLLFLFGFYVYDSFESATFNFKIDVVIFIV